jgi:hypothetical protein
LLVSTPRAITALDDVKRNTDWLDAQSSRHNTSNGGSGTSMTC